MAEIRWFAADFAPKNWALCAGQILPINTNQALFSLLGTVYGGNGVQTFGLPDSRSRVFVGTGPGLGLTNVALGDKSGVEQVTLLPTQMPLHTHLVQIQPTTGNGTGTINLIAANAPGTLATGGGNLLALDDGSGASDIFAAAGSPTTPMDSTSISMKATAVAATANLAAAGGNAPHSNVQPVLAINSIVCLYGMFPSRN